MKKIKILVTIFMAFLVAQSSVAQDSISRNQDTIFLEKDDIVANFILPLILEEAYDKENLNQKITKLRTKYDVPKDWLIYDVIPDSAYFKRLNIEEDDNKENTRDEIWRRQNELEYDYVMDTPENITKDLPGAVSYYDSVVHLPDTIVSETTMLHEYIHQIVRGGKDITEYATKLYRKAFDSTKVSSDTLFFKNKKGVWVKTSFTERSYYGNPVEIYAFQKEFHFLYCKLTGKSYGDGFTECDYDKAMEMLKKGVFDNEKNIMIFLKIIKHEYFIKIINTIA
ncbi:MAG: hypothetical protein NT068_03650 [Candidatus Nomurabacteria bacterium]|nr:hypothetical protein [Candidatus Nomurabacteria bacterium]